MTLPAVVINLPHRTDRLLAFRQAWGPGPHLSNGVLAATPQEGCRLAHEAVWRVLVDTTLVLEDDAVPLGLPHLPEIAGDWDLLMLGGQHHRSPAQVQPGVMRCLDTSRTHAYIVRAGRAPRLLAATAGATSDRHVSSLLRQAMRTGQLTCLAVDPWQVVQAPGHSDITGRHEDQDWQR